MAPALRAAIHGLTFAGALTVALTAAACAARNPGPASGPSGSDPLTDSDRDDPAARVWFDPAVDFTEYCHVIVDPVGVDFPPGAPARSLDPVVVAGLAEEFRNTLVRIVDPYYDVLDAPAPWTIRVRAALTDAEMKPGGATASDLIAARIEWEAFDATTGRRIGTGMRRREVPPDAPGFETWAEAMLDMLNRRADIGAGASGL